jgi:hypothetical protein
LVLITFIRAFLSLLLCRSDALSVSGIAWVGVRSPRTVPEID